MSSRNGHTPGRRRTTNPKPRLLGESKPLTPRELEVAQWIGRGKTNEQIGTFLGCSTGTVKKHVSHILQKLGLDNRVNICIWCQNEGKALLPQDGEEAA
jgi:DNA-binding NarL/FixJ family response regulator